MLRLSLILGLFFYQLSLNSQELAFRHITKDDGLSNNSVYKILKDSQGFMWFGTLNGLNKYDGQRIKVYDHDPQEPNSISNGSIQALMEDSRGYLWIGTKDGLNKYDPVKDEFVVYKHDPTDLNSLSHNEITDISEDMHGYLWVATRGGGLNRLDVNSREFQQYRYDPKDPHSIGQDDINVIHTDTSGYLWVGLNGKGLDLLEPETGEFYHLRYDQGDLSTNLENNLVRGIYQDESGSLWLSTKGGLNRLTFPSGNLPTMGRMLEPAAYQFKHYGIDHTASGKSINAVVRKVIGGIEGDLWMATYGGGINRFDPASRKFQHIQRDRKSIEGLNHNVIWDLYLDEGQQILWIGTDGGGVNQLNLQSKPFHHIPFDNAVSTIMEAYEEGHLWVGTSGDDNGLYRIDPITGKREHWEKQRVPKKGPSSNRITNLARDPQGAIWLATDNKGVNLLKEGNEGQPIFKHLSHQPNNPLSISYDAVSYVHVDRRGILWVATSKGLDLIDTKSLSVSRWEDMPGEDTDLDKDALSIIHETRDGAVWIGTYGACLYQLTPDGRKSNGYTVDIHKYDLKDSTTVSSNKIYDIHEDHKGNIWFATQKGFDRYQRDSDSFKRFAHLYKGIVLSILEDAKGTLWMGSANGLLRFDPVSEKIAIFNKEDGIKNRGLRKNSALNAKNGQLLFGGTEGITLFHPDSIHISEFRPVIKFTDLKIFNRSYKTRRVGTSDNSNVYLDKHINHTESVHLDYTDRSLTIEFSALDYQNPDKIAYSYRLKGFSDEWVSAGNDAKAEYTNLDPGRYILEVKATNHDRVWSSYPASLALNIPPPPWKTWWAYTVYTLLSVMTAYLIIRAFIARERQKARLELEKMEMEKGQELNAMKSRFFVNISHEFRTPLTLIAGPVNDLLENSKDPGSIRALEIVDRNCKRLKRLIDQLLDLSKLEVSKLEINKTAEDLYGLLRVTSSSFSSSAEKKQIEYHISIPNNSLYAFIDGEKIETVVYNLLSNAVKFTPPQGRVKISAEVKEMEGEQSLCLTVEDSGLGLNKDEKDKIFERFYRVDEQSAKEGTGIGLTLVKELVALMDGTLSLESEKGKGSCFSVTLPIELVRGDNTDTSTKTEIPIPSTRVEEEVLHLESKSSRVLLVEDNEDLRYYLRAVLGKEVQVIEAADGMAGLEIAQREVPDLIISDFMMPRMEGDELCRRLRQDDRTSHIPFIMLTAKVSQEDKLIGLGYGADDYLTKPFDKNEVRLRIRNILKRRESLQKKLRKSLVVHPEPTSVNSPEDLFIARLRECIIKNLSEPDLNVVFLSKEMGLSRVQLYRKVLALTGTPTSDLIREIRIHKAADLFRSHWDNVSQVAYEVGFNNLSYFTKCFKEVYHTTPSRFLKEQSTP